MDDYLFFPQHPLQSSGTQCCGKLHTREKKKSQNVDVCQFAIKRKKYPNEKMEMRENCCVRSKCITPVLQFRAHVVLWEGTK